MPTKNHIQVTKTARYFTLGELNEKTLEVWFVLHGYAQLASDFIKDFDYCFTFGVGNLCGFENDLANKFNIKYNEDT